MIVTQTTQDAVMELIKQCWIKDRLLDRAVSVLGVKFAMSNLSKYIHEDIAHYFTALSDQIGELCLERYNISVLYGATPAGYEDYESVEDIITTVKEQVIEFQSMFIATCRIAFDNNDLHVFADLQDLLEDYNPIVEQMILVDDKMRFYGEQKIMTMDNHSRNFWFLGGRNQNAEDD